MIKKILIYTLMFVLSLLFFLVATLPANFVWEQLFKQEVKNNIAGLNVESIDGSVWQGEALIAYRGISAVYGWDVSFAGLLTMSLPVSLTLRSQAGSVNVEADFGLSETVLAVENTELDLSYLTPLVKRWRVSLDGDLVVNSLILVVEDMKLVSLAGGGSWSGGDISYPVARQSHNRNMPVFNAVATTNDEGLAQIGIRDANAGFDVIYLSLDANGEAMAKVTRRLLDIADEDWPKNSQETDTVFKVKKVIY